jgi:hypothetical protein
MKKVIFLALALGATVSLAGCSTEENCDEEREGKFAIDIRLFGAECDYQGTVENQETGEVSDMDCGVSDGNCSCQGGTEFGVYRVTITDNTTSITDTALIAVEAAPPPVCLERDTIEGFSPIMGEGGAGGADSND